MKKVHGVLTIGAAFLVMVGTTGCQSGWKFSNPFSRAPKASHADAPDELDDDFAKVDDITPPPENYTVGDRELKKEKSSIVQKGRYGEESDSDERSVASSDAGAAVASEESADYRTPSYARNDKVDASASNDGSSFDVASTVPSNSSSPLGSFADSVGSASADASVAAATQPYSPQGGSSMRLYSSQNQNAVAADFASPASETPQSVGSVEEDPFPTAPSSVGSVGSANQIAQVSSTQGAGFGAGRSENVAFNYGSNSESSGSSSATDPYSDVIYSPQNASGGFAPGSVLY